VTGAGKRRGQAESHLLPFILLGFPFLYLLFSQCRSISEVSAE